MRTNRKDIASYKGNINSIRAVEDAIRSSKKYTEGVMTMRKTHPIQGEDFPSKVFCKYYEVYPELKISWDMPAGTAIDWLWGEYESIDVTFRYDYRANKAYITINDGDKAVKLLSKTIPYFRSALMKVEANGNSKK